MVEKKLMIYRAACAIVLVTITVAASVACGEKAMLYPVVAALAIGYWIVDKHVWCVSRRQFVALLAISSVCGILISNYSPLAKPINITMAFMIAAALLYLFRSTLMPVIATCLLPVMLGFVSWMYPLTVIIVAAIVVRVQKMMEKAGWRHSVEHLPHNCRKMELCRWLLLSVFVGLTAYVSSNFNVHYLMLPPVVVCFADMVQSRSGFRQRPFTTTLILLFAISVGTLFQYLHLSFNIPLYICAPIVFTSLIVVFMVSSKYFAPAGALSLIPMLLPADAIPTLPLQAMAGVVIFIIIALAINCCMPTAVISDNGERNR
jgi:hypothetical protein